MLFSNSVTARKAPAPPWEYPIIPMLFLSTLLYKALSLSTFKIKSNVSDALSPVPDCLSSLPTTINPHEANLLYAASKLKEATLLAFTTNIVG